jgi:four helix bundle protein
VTFKCEGLEVWQDAVSYVDRIYELVESLPRIEEFNLKSKIVRAATSVALDVAEGSTGQTDSEQARFLGMAIRSLIETVACLQLIRRRDYSIEATKLDDAHEAARVLASRLHAMRRSIDPERRWVRDPAEQYTPTPSDDESRN